MSRLRAGRSAVRIPVGARDFYLLQKTLRPALRPTQPPIPWVQGPFPRVKRPEREVNLSPPPRAEVNNECSYTFTSPICLHGMDKENLTFFTFYVVYYSKTVTRVYA